MVSEDCEQDEIPERAKPRTKEYITVDRYVVLEGREICIPVVVERPEGETVSKRYPL